MPRFGPDDIAVITFNDVPTINLTLKYEALGRLAIVNRRRYCERHGYRFISEVLIARDRPACWAKIPALLEALETHPWVLWADSDTIVFAEERRVEELCDPEYDLVVQSHDEFFRFRGIPPDVGRNRMPINTGVFLIRASEWSRKFLQRAYDQTQFIAGDEVWNGVGEQEAMIALLRELPEDRRRIKYVTGLQNHPRFYRPDDFFVHFYGNYARHRVPLAECDEVINRWSLAIHHAPELPSDRARFHWCCIQNKSPDSPVRGDLAKYFYQPADISAPRSGGV